MSDSITTIAKEVGVSISAVSHVLNGRAHKLSPTVQKQIQRAIKAHDYRPNALVRALQTKRTHVIGVIISTAQLSFFTEILTSVESTAKAERFQCFLCQSHSSTATMEKEIATLREYRVDGMIVAPVNSFVQRDLYRQLDARAVPFVIIDTEVDGVEAPYVGNDNVRIGWLATRHLLDLGHRRIACIRGHPETLTASERETGYRQALREAGIPWDEDLVVGDNFTIETGRKAVHTLMQKSVPFTGMVTSADLVAIGAMQELQRQGLRVPEDVSVVGCANLDICEMVTPQLTTVDQKPQEVGRAAFELLRQQIEGKTPQEKRILVSPELVVRESTARNVGNNDQ